ncbi:hypothetical protein EV176_000248 [Coemansia sp. RSA 451]|nr:hypothetical protein EV176_000248 [Coemansia sp. RSA 451]KAJ2547861.1 hypothetical protein IWW35_004432 [Coemansia sp. RSA 1878]
MDQTDTAQPVFIAQARQRTAHRPASDTQVATTDMHAKPAPDNSTESSNIGSSRILNIVKLGLWLWFLWWFVRYYELDRSLRNEPHTPRISMFWLYAAICSMLPFLYVYLYASVWRRRILGEPLDLDNWQADSNRLVYAATLGLLLAWIFAVVALFPGFGISSILIVAVCTVCFVAMTGAVESIF